MRNKNVLVLLVGLFVFQGVVLYFLGQPFVCNCGEIRLWVGAVLSPEMSQQIFDWYTFSHIIHGFLFYALLWWLFPRMSVWQRLIFAVGIEIAWEIAENTPWVINAYREQALAVGYAGDSILNSLCDTLSMVIGFLLARKLPVGVTVAIALFLELFVGYYIHDNLTLNILNFIYPFDFVRHFQSGV